MEKRTGVDAIGVRLGTERQSPKVTYLAETMSLSWGTSSEATSTALLSRPPGLFLQRHTEERVSCQGAKGEQKTTRRKGTGPDNGSGWIHLVPGTEGEINNRYIVLYVLTWLLETNVP